MGKTYANFQEHELLAKILVARLLPVEYDLMQAYLNKQLSERNRLDRLNGEIFASLQEVMEVRDTLLKHVYTLLGRPTGILLKHMPVAIDSHLSRVKDLEQTIGRLRKSNEVYAHENEKLRQEERHNHKLIGELYTELGGLYKRERGE